ncbi:unnamed protein product, partial [Amoebophrya sp. A120]
EVDRSTAEAVVVHRSEARGDWGSRLTFPQATPQVGWFTTKTGGVSSDLGGDWLRHRSPATYKQEYR